MNKLNKLNKLEQKKIFCDECHTPLEVKSQMLKGKLKGEEIIYEGKVLYGSNCCHEQTDNEIIKLNEKLLNETFRSHHDILSLEKIHKIPTMYSIGKRPLSIVLGWGELTFTRYFEGDIPTKTYANILLEIYKSPTSYLELLEQRKDLISASTYKKSKLATLEFIKLNSEVPDIFNYILNKCEDITQESVFKLAYYIKGFHLGFFNKDIIQKNIVLVSGKIEFDNINIKNFENYNYKLKNNIDLNVTEKLIADNVIKYFGCYSGKVLTEFISRELPFIKAMINDTKELNNLEIKEYFNSIIKKYNMISPLDIHLYAEEMFKLR